MGSQSKENYITIAKAFGIILMVIGHSGSPSWLGRFLYMYHMPLFFLCSGYFFKEITEQKALNTFFLKRIKGLYFPYLKWSVLFLLLHNLFCRINIYNALSNIYPYNAYDFLTHFLRTLLMTDYEILLRPFWFLKALLLASMLIAILSYLKNRYCTILRTEVLLALMLILTFLFRLANVHLPIIGDPSVITQSASYFLSGILFRKYEPTLHFNYILVMMTFFITALGSLIVKGSVDMRFVLPHFILPYYIFSLSGIIFTFCLSMELNRRAKTTIKKVLYYIGNHTMIILTLHLLALRLGSLLKIWIYNLPIEELSMHTKIPEHNEVFWIVYTVIGVSIPLLLQLLYEKVITSKK